MKSRSTNIKRSSLPPNLVKENENGIRIKVYIQGHMIGAPILEKQKGNKGTHLTSFGKELLAKYLSLNKHLSEEAENFIQWAASKQR